MKSMVLIFSCENLINIVPEIVMYPPSPKLAHFLADDNNILPLKEIETHCSNTIVLTNFTSELFLFSVAVYFPNTLTKKIFTKKIKLLLTAMMTFAIDVLDMGSENESISVMCKKYV